MGIVNDFKQRLQRKKLAEDADRERLQHERESRYRLENDRIAAVRAEQERIAQQAALDRARLPDKRRNEPGAAERIFVDEATKARIREPAQPLAKQNETRQERQKIATEKEARLQPVQSVPTLGTNAVSRTAVRETLSQKLIRESKQNTAAAQPAEAQNVKQYPKPEIARLEDRLLTKEQQDLRKINDDLKAHRITRETALDRELRVLTRPTNKNTIKPNHSAGRKITDEG